MNSIPFCESDAALLHTVFAGCGSSSIGLSGVLNTSLSLGHELLTFEQLDAGIARLVAAGLVTLRHNQIEPTDNALEFLTQVEAMDSSMDSLLDSVREWLQCCQGDAPSDGVRWSTGELTIEDYDAGFA
ncbi:MAG: hypothetical protein AAGJ40_12345 [Planctomycetota bacterium]